jgi:dTDP-glucose pyrophosphorylase
MINYRNHIIDNQATIKEALSKLNFLALDAILFVVDAEEKLQGALTDGDVRRGLLKGITIDDPITNIIEDNPAFIIKEKKNIHKLIDFRKNNFKIIPVVDNENKVINVVNFRFMRSYLPIDAIIMAGGRGKRLEPLTDTIPKPLIEVGNKCIMEHNVDRLALYGIDDFWFSVNYLGNQIINHFGDGKDKNHEIFYVTEDKPLGTIGAVSKIDNLKHEHVLLTNSDILTNLDYEKFYLDFLKRDADLSVLTIPYNVNIPYAILETSNNNILDFKEKPTYTYFSNGGIYLIKRSMLSYIPKNTHFNTTDLMQVLISKNKKVVSYPSSCYWLDIGQHADLEKAKKDISQINFN